MMIAKIAENTPNAITIEPTCFKAIQGVGCCNE